MSTPYTITEIKQLLRYRANLSTARSDGDNGEIDTLIHASVKRMCKLVSANDGGKRLTFKVGLALRGLGEPSSGADPTDFHPRPIPLGDLAAGHAGPHSAGETASIWQHWHHANPSGQDLVPAPPFMRLVRIDLVESGWQVGEGLQPFFSFSDADAIAAPLATWSGETVELRPSRMEAFGGNRTRRGHRDGGALGGRSVSNVPEDWSVVNTPTYRLVGADAILFSPPPATTSFIVIWYEGAPVFQDAAGTTTLMLEPDWFDYVIGDVGSKLVSRQADRELWQTLKGEMQEAAASIATESADDDANYGGCVRRTYDYGFRRRFEGDWEPTA